MSGGEDGYLRKTYDLVHLAWNQPPNPSYRLRVSSGLSFLYQEDAFQDRREKVPGVKPAKPQPSSV